MKTTFKTITFAITHFSVAFTVAYMLTGSLVIGGAIALVEPAINTVAYMIHEKIWESGFSFSWSHNHSHEHIQEPCVGQAC